jgi:hypothetical protein
MLALLRREFLNQVRGDTEHLAPRTMPPISHQREEALLDQDAASGWCAAEKVRAVLLWHALAHNMARLWSLSPA